jgi:hypothetical protein
MATKVIVIKFYANNGDYFIISLYIILVSYMPSQLVMATTVIVIKFLC